VLVFSSIDARPILREAEDYELPIDYNTRVSVQITNAESLNESDPDASWDSRNKVLTIHETLSRRVRKLISALDVRVEVIDKIKNRAYIHEPEWETCTSREFLEDVLSGLASTDKQKLLDAHEALICDLKNSKGERVGRAALLMAVGMYGHYAKNSAKLTSVGGFCYPSSMLNESDLDFDYIGVLHGDTEYITRSFGTPKVPAKSIANWATNQAKLIDQERFSTKTLMRSCHSILRLGGDPQGLPFCFLNGGLRTYAEFRKLASSVGCFRIPLREDYRDNLQFITIHEIDIRYFVNHPISELMVIQIGEVHSDLLSKDDAVSGSDDNLSVDDIKHVSTQCSLILEIIEEIWSSKAKIKIERYQIFSDKIYDPPELQWTLTLAR